MIQRYAIITFGIKVHVNRKIKNAEFAHEPDLLRPAFLLSRVSRPQTKMQKNHS